MSNAPENLQPNTEAELQDSIKTLKRDPSLDLQALMDNAQIPSGASETKKTPLEEMMEQGSNKGMPVTKQELKDGMALQPLRANNETPEFEKGVKAELAELDGMIAEAKSNAGITPTSDLKSHLAMIDHLSGHDYKEELRETMLMRKRDQYAAQGKKPSEATVSDEELERAYQEWLQSEDGMYAMSFQKDLRAGRKINPNPEGIEIAKKNTPVDDNSSNDESSAEDTSDSTDDNTEEIDPEKEQMIQVIIDKTGFGADVHFTPEEQEKIIKSSRIIVTEVESTDLETIEVEDADKSFMEIAAENTITGIQTPVMFPMSMFRATMTGMSFGDLNSVATNPQNSSVESMSRQLSIIYNNLTNVSIGKFPSYDEFLNGFFMSDLDMALFGVACSTLPEEDSITMECGRCKRDYDYSYSPRALLDLRSLDKKILDRFDKLIGATDLFTAKRLFEENPLKKTKRIKLPYSNVIVECGFITCAEFFNSKTAQIFSDPEAVAERLGSRAEVYMSLATLLFLVRSVLVPHNGKWIRFKEADDVLEAIYGLKPQDVTILMNYLGQFSAPYGVSFSIYNVKCPHCGAITKRVNVDIQNLVFQRTGALRALDVELKGMPG